MAAGRGGEELTPVGGIYATVVIDVGQTGSQLDGIKAVLNLTDLEFKKLQASATASMDATKVSVDRAAQSVDRFTKDSSALYVSMSNAIEGSFAKLDNIVQRFNDKQMSLKETQAAYRAEMTRANSLTSERAAKEETYIQALTRSQHAHIALDEAIKRFGAGSMQAIMATDRAKAANDNASVAAKQLQGANDALGGSYTRLGQLQNQAGGMQSAMADRTMAFTRMTYFAAQGLEDWAYGFRAVVNNIPLVANELGKLIGLTPQMSMGFAAVASIAGTIIANFDSIKKGFDGILYAGIRITKDATTEMAELGKVTEKTAEQQERYNKLKEEQGRIDAILKIQSHEQEAQRGAFETAMKNAGGSQAVFKSLKEIHQAGGETQDPAAEEKIANLQAAIAERKTDDFQKRALQRLLAKAEADYATARGTKAGELAKGDLRRAETDPQALESLIGKVRDRPGAFKPGLLEDLEHARPEQAIKDKIAGLDRDPFKAQKKAAEEAKKSAKDAETDVEKVATDVFEGLYKAWLKGADIDRARIAEILVASGKAGTEAEIDVAEKKLDELQRDKIAKGRADLFQRRGGVGPLPTDQEVGEDLRRQLEEKEKREHEAIVKKADAEEKREARAELHKPTQKEIAEQKAIGGMASAVGSGRVGKMMLADIQRRVHGGMSVEDAESEAMDRSLPGLTKEFGEEAGHKIAFRVAEQKARQVRAAEAAKFKKMAAGGVRPRVGDGRGGQAITVPDETIGGEKAIVEQLQKLNVTLGEMKANEQLDRMS